tara:strand:+ start:937 stop:1188 length:252 start_codon:yes stop_codon:yes gene_type:complete
MGQFDRQIANALDKVHRDLSGVNNGDCRWFYSGKLDIYHCPHTAIAGKDLMLLIPDWEHWNTIEIPTPATLAGDKSPESKHTL